MFQFDLFFSSEFALEESLHLWQKVPSIFQHTHILYSNYK